MVVERSGPTELPSCGFGVCAGNSPEDGGWVSVCAGEKNEGRLKRSLSEMPINAPKMLRGGLMSVFQVEFEIARHLGPLAWGVCPFLKTPVRENRKAGEQICLWCVGV